MSCKYHNKPFPQSHSTLRQWSWKMEACGFYWQWICTSKIDDCRGRHVHTHNAVWSLLGNKSKVQTKWHEETPAVYLSFIGDAVKAKRCSKLMVNVPWGLNYFCSLQESKEAGDLADSHSRSSPDANVDLDWFTLIHSSDEGVEWPLWGT